MDGRTDGRPAVSSIGLCTIGLFLFQIILSSVYGPINFLCLAKMDASFMLLVLTAGRSTAKIFTSHLLPVEYIFRIFKILSLFEVENNLLMLGLKIAERIRRRLNLVCFITLQKTSEFSEVFLSGKNTTKPN